MQGFRVLLSVVSALPWLPLVEVVAKTDKVILIDRGLGCLTSRSLMDGVSFGGDHVSRS